MTAADRIRVHPQDAGLRKQLPQLLLYLLRARSDVLHHTAALRTDVSGPLGMAAVMAHQPPVGGMVGHRHAAPGTFRHIAAFAAQHIAAAAPAVQKQDALLTAGKIFLNFLPE